MLIKRLILGGMLAVGLASFAAAEPAMRPLSRDDAIAARLAVERARLAAYRPAPRPAHMVRYPVAIETRTPEVRPVARSGYLPDARWDFRGDSDIWTRAAMSAIAGHGDKLYQQVPADIENWCPAYADKGVQERRAFWIGLFSALAKHESTWRPEAVGGGGQWYGLLQVLPSTARLYGCRATTGQALKNPVENLSCSVRIAAHQVNRRGTVARGMLDWGPFHSQSKRRDMAAWTRAQDYCQPDRNIRPVARPLVATVSTMDVVSP